MHFMQCALQCILCSKQLWQAGWFLRPNCVPRFKCSQFGMPAERRAQFRVPNMPRSRISERAPFRTYEHTQCRVFERTSLQRAYVIPCRQQMGSSAVIWACHSALVLTACTRCLRRAHSIGWGCRIHTCVMAIGADFKMYLLHQFRWNQVEFFLQYTADTDAKNDGLEFWNSNSRI